VVERLLDDFVAGERFTTRGCTLSEAQILAFALEWDPQPFHLDKTFADDGAHGGLIASGFQTLLVSFRLWLAEGVINAASLGSPGMDELRWIAPVTRSGSRPRSSRSARRARSPTAARRSSPMRC